MWFYLALLSAFFNALSNIARRTHGSLAQPAELAWWSLLLSLPLGIGLVLLENRPFWDSTDFLLPALIVSGINAYAGTLLFRAYKFGDASAVSPIANFLPIGLVATSFFILGTTPSFPGLAGILLIVAGVYYSSVGGRHDLIHPIRSLTRNRGSQSMMGWVFLMSVSTAFAALALRSVTPSFLLLFVQVTELILISGYLLARPQRHRIRHGEKVLHKWGWHLAAIAVFTTLSVFFQLQAMNLMDISYVLSVKRLDILLTVLMAGLFLKERHILRRFKGSAIALVGVVVILVAG